MVRRGSVEDQLADREFAALRHRPAVHASLEGRSGASTDVISDSAWLANLHDRSWSFTEVSSYCPPVRRADGEQIIYHDTKQVARGDVVVCEQPPAGSGRLFVKRVIGLGGDTVEVKAGQVLVSGQVLAEPYLQKPTGYTATIVSVPTGFIYLFGGGEIRVVDV